MPKIKTDSYREVRDGYGTRSITFTGTETVTMTVPLCSRWIRIRPRSSFNYCNVFQFGEPVMAHPDVPLWLYVANADSIEIEGNTNTVDLVWYHSAPGGLDNHAH
tara:strand:- start:244 stop:558 length:315 start_codon:yes stop_codon:yes gene_type:complete